LTGWFINLYKVQEMVKKIYGKKNYGSLGIGQPEWSTFERLLNGHDLRHAKESANFQPIDRDDVDWLFTTARWWVILHLKESKSLVT
jgi:hypothetical protein